MDSGRPQMTGTVLVKVKVGDINDNPPFFTQHNYTAVVQVSLLDIINAEKNVMMSKEECHKLNFPCQTDMHQLPPGSTTISNFI